MRPLIFTAFLLLVTLASGQDMKPRITGQKELSVQQGKSITLTTADLDVKETPTGNDNGNGGDDGSNDNDDDTGGDDDDDGDNDENSGEDDKNGTGNDNPGTDDDNSENEDDEDEGEKDDEDEGEKEEEDEDEDDDDGDSDEDKDDSDGDKDDEKDSKDDKDDKGNKNDKDNKDDKDDKGNKDGQGGNNDGKKGKGKDGGRTLVYPQGYTLEIFPGKNYTFSGTTVTPDPAFTGTLYVAIRVKNATHASPKYDLKITVKPVTAPANKPPVINGQVALATSMDNPITIRFSDLLVSDPDDTYPEGFTIVLQQGENYTVSGLTVTPVPGFTGSLSVPTQVSDGENTSTAYDLKITVKKTSTPNIAPVISGQLPLSISMNQSVKILLSQLMVQDPDNKYPDDFTLKLFPGANYTVDGATVRPHAGFTGDLTVNVAVHDGVSESNVYPLRITVSQMANEKPVITGQAGLKIPQGQSLEIKPFHLVVQDPDNVYPEEFTLTVSSGSNYSVSNNTVTPVANFLGTLTVSISVNDGKISSDLFALKVEVIPVDKLEIVGQRSIEMTEDSSIAVSLSHLNVNDPSNTFPKGFSLQILPGNNYEANSNTIRPHSDFAGNLTVPVTLKKGNITSPAFSLLIVVNPVNDPPELVDPPTDPVAVNGQVPWTLFPNAEIRDVDDDHLLFAEMGFLPGTFNPTTDKFQYEAVESIHAVVDESTGVLFMVGRAPLTDYQKVIRSVTYTFRGSPDSVSGQSKGVYLTMNDGKNASTDYERLLMFDTDVSLDIPSAFTPNNDNANDTWKITPMLHAEQMRTFVRVFDKKGNMVFESAQLDREWDGHYNGSPLPADVYFYTIEMDLSYRRVSYKGIVTILR